MPETIKLDIIKKCIKDFNGKGKFKNIFNTASFQLNVTKYFDLDHILSEKVARTVLKNSDNILQLIGGCHWILIS